MTIRLLFLILVLLLAAPRLSAQADSRLYFLGRADTDGDGMINTQDRLALYRSEGGAEAERLSDEAVDVAGYLAADSGAVAYLGVFGGSLVLDILPSDAAPLHVALDDFGAAQLLALDDALWLVGVGADGIPVIRSIDVHSGAQIAERKLRRSGTQVTASVDGADGAFALAYNAEAGAISVFRLSDLQAVAFDLSGYALAAPVWSPTASRFLLAAARLDDPADFGVFVVDPVAGTSRWLDAPDFPDAATVSAAWSGGGRYITYTAPVPDAPVYLLDTDSPDSAPRQLPAGRVVAWAAGDALALLLQSAASADDRAAYFTLDPADGQLTPFAALDAISPSLLSFAPQGNQLALIGQSHFSGEYGLFFASPGDAAAEVLFSSPDPAVSLGASLQWSPDGGALIYTAASLDPLLTSLGTPLALYVYDRAEGTSERLSPENVLVRDGSVRVM